MSLPDGRKVVAVDFDGVLHDYHGWNKGQLGHAMPGMLYVVDQLISEGVYVVIHTTREAEIIAPWLAAHGFPDLPVYNTKWSRIDVFVDRAYTFNPLCSAGENADAFVRALLDFQPHWRRLPEPAEPMPARRLCRRCEALTRAVGAPARCLAHHGVAGDRG